MEQGQDKLVTCKCCGSDACYESEFTTQEGPITTWMCMTCGFTSNTTMENDNETVKLAEETTADLIKDLKQVHDNLAWFPTVITMPEKGMIFPEPINPGTFYKNKMDMKNPLRFDKLCFMDAAEELGMFVKQPV